MTDVERVRAEYRERNVRWGFAWALWCAVLWGAWYVPGSAIYFEEPFATVSKTTGGYLKAAAAITTLNAVAVLLAMLLWTAVLGKTRDYGRTLRQVRHISKWFAAGAMFGGPVAIYGTFLAIGFVGAQFGAVAGLLYPVVGAFLARLWLKERVTARAAIGILIVVIGGVCIFTPGLLDEISGGAKNAWIGYLGGLMATIGWGVEGVLAGKALDVTDPDVGLTVRFTAESLYWVVLIIPVASIFLGGELYSIMGDAIANPINLVWLLLAGLTFGFCYVSWYKSFPLIGVGRGQAIADLYGMFALLWLTIFTFDLPSWQFIVGGLIAILGGFTLFTEKRGVLEVVRSMPHMHAPSREQAPPPMAGVER